MKRYYETWGDEPPSIHRPDATRTYTSDNIRIVPKRLNSCWTRQRALDRSIAGTVRRMRKAGQKVTALARRFNTSVRCISDCCNGRYYLVEDELTNGKLEVFR